MATVALLLGVGYVVVVFIVEPLRLRRRTGSSGWVASLGATAVEKTRASSAAAHTGPFRVVRNPTYTSLLANSLALGLLVATPAALTAVLVCLSALQLQTRRVEEPHLRRVHGGDYQRYARQVGRFFPTVGRFYAP